ncbi:MAG: signal peptide peptidase SppA [Candidatus Hodarchaeales archaeon]|jgi:protease-4
MVFFSPIRRLRNTKRTIFKTKFDYAYLSLPSEFPLRNPPPQPFLQRLLFPISTFSLEYVENLIKNLKKSKIVKGLIVELPLQLSFSLGFIQQIQSILKSFQEKGKKLIFISKNYSIQSYFFASIADKVLLLPSGVLNTNGLFWSSLFMKNAIEKAGFQFEKVAVSGYKSAYDQFSLDNIAPEAKENIEWLLKDQMRILQQGIQEYRKMTPEDVVDLINKSPFVDSEALDKEYIDGLVRPEELSEYLSLDKRPAKIVYFSRTPKLLLIPKKRSYKKLIGIITVTGAIMDGESQQKPPSPVPIPLPLIPEEVAGDKTIVQIIRNVRRDPRFVGAILLVDSPGGSISASEEIRAALEKLAQTKPLVSYFNGVSASGGYYIATPAQWIVAQSSTITGSIGVLGAKLNFQALLKKLSITIATSQEGDRAHWSLPHEPFSDEERKSFQYIIDHTYDRFLEYVSNSRQGMSKDDVKKIAGGRVWTGSQALENGLIDQLGSLNDAYLKVCEIVDIHPNIPMVTVQAPKKPSIPPFPLKKKNQYIIEPYYDYIKPFLSTTLWMRDFSL